MISRRRFGRSDRTSEPGRSPKLQQRPGAFEPDPGPFAVSYFMLDHSGPFAWPHDGDDIDLDLRRLMDNLTRRSLDQVLKVTRQTGSPANKPIEVHDVSQDAQRQLDRLEARLQTDADLSLWEFTYCLRRWDPRRIWAWADLEQRHIYPIWWDPEHRVMGFRKQQADVHVGGPCLPECPHPDLPGAAPRV